MKDLITLLLHLITTIAKLLGSGGAKAVVAHSLLLKQQLLVINCSHKRVHSLSAHYKFSLASGRLNSNNVLSRNPTRQFDQNRCPDGFLSVIL